MEDGVYFDIAEGDYHAIPRFSASGVCDFMISPADFWARSWMNPNKEDKDTDAKTNGRAYHSAILEPHLFNEKYVRDICEADFTGVLTNGTQIGEALAFLGEPKTKAGETVLEKAYRLLEAGYKGHIMQIEREKFELNVGTRTIIKPEAFQQIITDAAIIQQNKEIADLIAPGFAEVTILFTVNGVPMKSRLDKLQAQAFIDLKTFDNVMGKQIEQCIADNIRYNRQYLKAYVYHLAIEAIRGQKLEAHGTQEQADMVAEIRGTKSPLDPWYVFIQKQGVPNIMAKRIPILRSFNAEDGGQHYSYSMLGAKARREFEWCLSMYKFHVEEFGTDGKPWVPIHAKADVDENNFNTYWLDN